MKTLKSLLAAMLAIIILFAFVGCSDSPTDNSTDDDEKETSETRDESESESKGGSGTKTGTIPDYDTLIDSFVSSPMNTFELTVGEEASTAVGGVMQSGKTTVYSSDESVVTVTDLGKVTAVGEGSAYVIITSQDGSMSAVYRYDVYAAASEADVSGLPAIDGVDFAYEIENFNSTPLNTFTLKVGDGHTPTAAVWANNGSCYTSDETVVTVARNGNVFAQGTGTAYVVIKSGVGSMFEIYKYIVNG